MSLNFRCPQCGTESQAQDNMAGRDIRCGSCGAVYVVPRQRTESASDSDRSREPEPPFRDRGTDSSEELPGRGPRFRDRYDSAGYDEPPRRRGRGPLFWIVMIFAIMFLGCCACCGGGYLMLPGENWYLYESSEGGFAVDLPAPIQQNMSLPGVDLEPGQKVEGAILWKRAEFYAVMYTTARKGAAADELLDELVANMRADPESRVIRVDNIKVSGYPGRELEYVHEDGGTYISRSVVADGRLLIAVGGGRLTRSDNANVRRFLDSFTITKPGPK